MKLFFAWVCLASIAGWTVFVMFCWVIAWLVSL